MDPGVCWRGGEGKGHSSAYVPKVLDHLCTERLVVMEWIQVRMWWGGEGVVVG